MSPLSIPHVSVSVACGNGSRIVGAVEPPPIETDDIDDEDSVREDEGDYGEAEVVVYRTDNRLDASMLEDALLREGFDARTRSVLAVPVQLELVVSASDAEGARACIANLEAPGPTASAGAPGNANALDGKSARIAWGLALLPGCAHLYAGASIRGLVLLIALFSCLYWARFDHLTLAAPLFLFALDALGATTLIAGKTSRVWTALVFTAPLWVAGPPTLLQHAPGLYIGSSGREICAFLDRCGEASPTCQQAIARQIGASVSVRGKTRDCAAFLAGAHCQLLDDADGRPPPALDGCYQLFEGTAHLGDGREHTRTFRPAHRGWGM